MEGESLPGDSRVPEAAWYDAVVRPPQPRPPRLARSALILSQSLVLAVATPVGCARVGYHAGADARGGDASRGDARDGGGGDGHGDGPTPGAPVLSLVVAANSDDPIVPPSAADRRVLAGAPVYLRWRVTAAGPLAPTPIALEVTTDGQTFTPVASALPDAAGAGCTLRGAESGCHRLSAPSSGYFKLRVSATDAAGRRGQAVTPPLNAASPRVEVSAAAVDQPDRPPTDAQVTVAAGGGVHVKWRATDDLALPAAPISLAFTSDDLTYTTIASALPNAAGAGCTVSGAETGCFVWKGGAPAGYFRVRVLAQDLDGAVAAASSGPFNVSPPLRFLAGNTDPATDVSAGSTVFLNQLDPVQPDAASLVVTPTGAAYFRDAARGLLKIDPADGVVRVLIPFGAASSGDGGPARQATLRAVGRLALDQQGRVLLFDHDRIRRVDPGAPGEPITTVVGGGSSTADGVTGPEVQLEVDDGAGKHRLLFTLPNGDLYFRGDGLWKSPAGGARIRVLRAASGRVESLSVSGKGDGLDPTQDLAACELVNYGVVYDPKTSQLQAALAESMRYLALPGCAGAGQGLTGWARLDPTTGSAVGPHPANPEPLRWVWGGNIPVQGLDGQLYLVSRASARIYRLDLATSAWVPVLGTGTPGACGDGTAALACAVDPQDVFVDARGRLTFVERGQVRALDAAGQVITLFGQSLHSGDGGDARSARFGAVASLALWQSGASQRVVVLDPSELRLREAVIGGVIQTLAGDGGNAPLDTTLAPTAQGYYLDYDRPAVHLLVEPATGDLLVGSAASVMRLTRSTNRWSRVVGGGTTPYQSADGRRGDEISLDDAYSPQLLGLDASGVLACHHTWGESCRNVADTMLKRHALADGTQSHVAGVKACGVPTSCPDGAQLATCKLHDCMGWLPGEWDAAAGRWLLADYADTSISTAVPGGKAGTLTKLQQGVVAFAFTRQAETELLYYCDVDGRLHRVNVSSGNEVALAWPVPGMSCTGDRLIYSASRKSLIFAYVQHGMAGVAEYTAP